MYVLFVSFSFWTPYHGCNLFVILFSLFEWRWWYCDRCKCNSFNIFCIQIPITIVSCRVYIFHSIVTQTLIVLLNGTYPINENIQSDWMIRQSEICFQIYVPLSPLWPWHKHTHMRVFSIIYFNLYVEITHIHTRR